MQTSGVVCEEEEEEEEEIECVKLMLQIGIRQIHPSQADAIFAARKRRRNTGI